MMRKGCVYMVTCLVMLFIVEAITSAIVSDPPQSKNATHEEQLKFTCTVVAEEIDYFVNGTNAQENDIIDKGFTLSGITDINDTTRQQQLTAIAMVEYNITEITCRALNTMNGVSLMISESAFILVQGPLSPVVDLSYSFIDSSTVNISWSPPFTLLGTNITGYNISATSNGTTTNYFTSDSYYVLLLTDITNSPCDEIIITVSGYNGLDGDIHSVSYPPVPDYSIIVGITNLTEVGSDVVNFKLTFNVSGFCEHQFPTRVNVTILYENGSIVDTHYNIPLVLVSDDLLVIEDTLKLYEDQKYQTTITFSSEMMSLNFITSHLMFGTHAIFGIVEADIVTPDIEFVCEFHPNTEAVGCLIELVMVENQNLEFANIGHRIGDKAIVQFQGLISGLWSLTAFDLENDQSTSAALNIQLELISSIVTPSRTSPSSSSSPSLVLTFLQSHSSYSISSSREPNKSIDVTLSNDNSRTSVIIGVGALVASILSIIIIIIMAVICCIFLHSRKLASRRAAYPREEQTDSQHNDSDREFVYTKGKRGSNDMTGTKLKYRQDNQSIATDDAGLQASDRAPLLPESPKVNEHSFPFTGSKGNKKMKYNSEPQGVEESGIEEIVITPPSHISKNLKEEQQGEVTYAVLAHVSKEKRPKPPLLSGSTGKPPIYSEIQVTNYRLEAETTDL